MKKSLTLNRFILLLFVMLAMGSSCKKDKGDDEGSGEAGISFKANGVQKRFDITAVQYIREGVTIFYLFLERWKTMMAHL